MQLTCPSCGGAVPHYSRFSAFFVCPTCKATIVKSDAGLNSHGKVAELPADMSPIQIGTTGYHCGKSFTILGRQRVGWGDGFWNEWYAQMDDGREGWLGESMGFYMFSYPLKEFKAKVLECDKLLVGRSYLMPDGKMWEVDDRRSVFTEGFEGELPFRPELNRHAISVDVSDHERGFANLFVEGDKAYFYLGEYLNYDDFRFKNVRTFDGW